MNNQQNPIEVQAITPERNPDLFEKVGITSGSVDAVQVEKIGFWTIAWEQFRKNKLAMAGLYCLVFLLIIAVYAPVFTLDKPFFYYTSKEGVFLPWFISLFDRQFFKNGVDIFFNLLMALSPIYLFTWYALRKKLRKAFGVYFMSIVSGFVVFQMAAFGLLMQYGSYSRPYKYYHRFEPEVLKSQTREDQKTYYLYPLRSYNSRTTDTTDVNPRRPDRKYWFGTNREGNDVLAVMIYGTRISLTIGVVAVAIFTIIGIILGAMAGYFAGVFDLLISRFIEVMLCFPTLFLILTLVAFFKDNTSIFHIMVVIGLTRWATVARLVRADFLRLRHIEYVEAAVALGLGKMRIMFGHILPNAMGPILVSATFGVASSILFESTLAFLGLGDPGAPSWGMLLKQGRDTWATWLIMIPGFAIFFVVSVLNLVGEGLQDALDPKLRR